LSGSVLVESVGELSNCRWDLEALVEDDLLTLKTNVLRPFDEAGQVSLGTNILADTEVLGIRLEEGILLGFCGLAGTEGGSSGLLA